MRQNRASKLPTVLTELNGRRLRGGCEAVVVLLCALCVHVGCAVARVLLPPRTFGSQKNFFRQLDSNPYMHPESLVPAPLVFLLPPSPSLVCLEMMQSALNNTCTNHQSMPKTVEEQGARLVRFGNWT